MYSKAEQFIRILEGKNMNYLQLTFVFIWLFVSASDVIGGRVLVLCPMSSQSHRNVMEGMYADLADRGHEIVVVTSGKPFKPTKNVKEVLVFESFDYFKSMSTLEVRQGGLLGLLMGDYSFMFDYCRNIYENEEVKKIMNEHFDLIMYDAIGNQCTYGIAHKIGAPVITVSTCAATPAIVGKVGNRLPPSFVPDMSAPYTGEMTFLQRTANIFFSYITELMFEVDIDKYEAIYREYVGQDAPSAVDFEANSSLILVNAHLSFDSPKPLLPDVIEVGGAHCRPGKPLPKELNEFVSGAKEGLILFSLGSIVKPHELPIEISKKFLNVFAKLKQRVLWKWPLEMNDLPPNVKLTKWVPQQDVLAHPNTKLFMTHGGLLSTQEAIYHGVPMIYFPVFGDQDNNALRATAIGIGQFHEILDFTEEDLEASIREILKNSSYREKIQKLAVIFKDQPQTPKERATFWAEYVMKHKGAPHLRSTARKLNFIQYHSLDSIAFILIVLSAILWVVKIAIVKAFRLCCSRSVSPSGTKKFN